MYEFWNIAVSWINLHLTSMHFNAFFFFFVLAKHIFQNALEKQEPSMCYTLMYFPCTFTAKASLHIDSLFDVAQTDSLCSMETNVWLLKTKKKANKKERKIKMFVPSRK